MFDDNATISDDMLSALLTSDTGSAGKKRGRPRKDSTTNTDTSAEGTTEGQEKRHYTSSRTTAYNTVLTLIAAKLTEESEDESVCAVLSDLVSQIEQVRDNPTTTPNRDPNVPKRSYVAGGAKERHFVTETATGEREYVSIRLGEAQAMQETFAHIYGPFRTRGGADYVVRNGASDSNPRVF